MEANPCLDCGACCACFRVSFYWGEISPVSSPGVPDEFTEKLNHHRAVMLGTNQKNPYCIALQGRIGENVSCGIYEQRPSPCREFAAGSEGCSSARKKHGMAELVDYLPGECA
jgi:Fe-S-cluster containining protein